ncbi:MAG: sugar transferase [Planctomycetota bacterium]|nr:MAG: sugar transferase [Planctomycetota bacterium]
MLQRHHLIIQRVLSYLDLALVFLSWWASLKIRLGIKIDNQIFIHDSEAQLLQIGLAVVHVVAVYRLFGLYHRSRRASSPFDEIGRLVLANLLVFAGVMASVFAFQVPTASRLQILLFVGLNTALVVVSRLAIRFVARYLRRRGYNFRHLVIIKNPRHDPEPLLERIKEHAFWGFRIIGIVDPVPGPDGLMVEVPEFTGDPEDPPAILNLETAEGYLDEAPVDEIWVDGPPDEDNEVYEFIARASDRGSRVRYVLARNFVPGVRWGFETFDTITTLSATRTTMDDLALFTKRLIDLTAASLILLLTSPVMLFTALALLMEKEGGILFRQERVGLNGRRFELLKFRSMVANAEAKRKELEAMNEMSGPVFKMTNDPRITRIGRFIRKWSIDELPQLFNVLVGDMSLVGPRPPLPTEVDLYERRQRRRLSVKPGITGLWQVSGRNEIDDFERWVELDLEYIESWSLKLDFSILFRTIPAVLFAKGAR